MVDDYYAERYGVQDPCQLRCSARPGPHVQLDSGPTIPPGHRFAGVVDASLRVYLFRSSLARRALLRLIPLLARGVELVLLSLSPLLKKPGREAFFLER
jgi:hypothetical protein